VTDLSLITDEELTERAREVFRQLWRTPRAHPDNEHLIRTWGALCAQMKRSRIVDTLGHMQPKLLGQIMSKQTLIHATRAGCAPRRAGAARHRRPARPGGRA